MNHLLNPSPSFPDPYIQQLRDSQVPRSASSFRKNPAFLRYFHTMMDFRQTRHWGTAFPSVGLLFRFFICYFHLIPLFRKTNNVVQRKLYLNYTISLSYAIGKQSCANKKHFLRKVFTRRYSIEYAYSPS